MKSLIILISFLYTFADNSIYIWSKTFDKFNNSDLITILENNHINHVMISSKNIEKFKNFIKLAHKNNIKVEILIGDNSWIYDYKQYKIDEKLKYFKELDNFNIHLDVEPHAIKSLKHHRKEYFNMYIKMLEYIHHKYPNYNISISIPTFYKLDFQKINFVKKIYLMAYQYKNLSQLLRRVNRYKFLNNIVVVFNCKEFKSKKKLLHDISFIQKYGYKDIALHSLKTCLRIDN